MSTSLHVAVNEKKVPKWPLLFVIVLLFLLWSGSLFDPYIAHDDFDWLIPQGFDQGFESPWSKAGTEGRWINYPWSLISVYLSPNQAYFIFIGLACCAALLASKAIAGKASLLPALLLFFSPTAAYLSQWPVTQISSLVFLCTGIWALTLTKSFLEEMSLLSILVIVSFLSYPTYAPFSAILIAASRERTDKQFIISAIVYVCAFATAILIAFSLNYIFQGNFGIRVAAWRNPTPLFPHGDLTYNLKKYGQYWIDITAYWPAIIASAVAYCYCFMAKIETRKCFSVLFLTALIISMEAVMSVISGLEFPAKTSIWFWLVLSIPIIYIIGNGKNIFISTVCAALVLCSGLFAWHTLYTKYSRVFPTMKHLGQLLSQASANNEGKFQKIIVFGDNYSNFGLNYMQSNRQFRNYLFKVYGLYTVSCAPDNCLAIEEYIEKEKFVSSVELIDDNLVLIISDKRGSTH